jgi:TM2 domain-containing membrane protein YozV
MRGRGSTANVIAALASFLLPGLGQLVQGRVAAALICVFFGVVGFFAVMGYGALGMAGLAAVSAAAAYDAAMWDPEQSARR